MVSKQKITAQRFFTPYENLKRKNSTSKIEKQAYYIA